LSNLKPVSRIQANRFGDGLVKRTRMADGEAVYLHSKRCLFHNLCLQSVSNNALVTHRYSYASRWAL